MPGASQATCHSVPEGKRRRSSVSHGISQVFPYKGQCTSQDSGWNIRIIIVPKSWDSWCSLREETTVEAIKNMLAGKIKEWTLYSICQQFSWLNWYSCAWVRKHIYSCIKIYTDIQICYVERTKSTFTYICNSINLHSSHFRTLIIQAESLLFFK